MIRIFFYLAILMYINAEDFNNHPRLVYIQQELLTNEDSNKYIGENIAVKYRIITLDNARIRSIGFINKDSSVEIKNENSLWNSIDDSTIENTFYYKIKTINYTLPTLEVVVNNDDFEEKALSDIVSSKAIKLDSPDYSGVVAKQLEVMKYNTHQYSDTENIILMQIQANDANLEDFKIKNIKKQGFQESFFNISQSTALYYVIISNKIKKINFSYFSSSDNEYKTITINNIASSKDNISVNEELNPINKVLIFQNIIIVCVIIALIVLLFIKKIPFKIKLAMLGIAIILLIYLLITINIKKEGILKANSYISILPIENSTIVEQVENSVKVEIINSHKNYYKIIIGNKTGWVKKSEIE